MEPPHSPFTESGLWLPGYRKASGCISGLFLSPFLAILGKAYISGTPKPVVATAQSLLNKTRVRSAWEGKKRMTKRESHCFNSGAVSVFGCELNELKHACLLGTYGKGTLTLDPAGLILRKRHGPQGFPSTAAPWLTEHGRAGPGRKDRTLSIWS